MKNQIPNYKILDQEGENGTCLFEIEEGSFSGFKYRYGVVSFDDSDAENPVLRFSYEVDESSENYEVNNDLVDIMGQILVEVFDGRSEKR